MFQSVLTINFCVYSQHTLYIYRRYNNMPRGFASNFNRISCYSLTLLF